MLGCGEEYLSINTELHQGSAWSASKAGCDEGVLHTVGQGASQNSISQPD